MSNDGVNPGRRRFLVAATSVVGAAGVIGAAVPFVGSWSPSAKLEPGRMMTVEWRGKPVFIVRRTEQALASLQNVEAELTDPASEAADSVQPDYAKNPYRSIKEEYLVVVGLCTHLGCSPKYRPEVGFIDAEWEGGFFCPCHGSKFDMAGRVYKGVPAPSNLEVPPYHYETEKVVVIGIGPEAA